FSSSGHDGYFGCLAASGGTHPSDCVVRNGGFYFEYFYGTSAAAPDMAGITALLNQKFQSPQGELNQRLYYLAAKPSLKVFNDVTAATSGVSGCAITTPSMCNNSTPSPTSLSGGLSGYLVTDGFDEVTGLGSIDVSSLLANWYAGFPATTSTVISSVNPAYQGQTVTFTATVATTGSKPPTGKVTFFNSYYAFPFGAMGTGFLRTVRGAQVATFTTSTLAVGSYAVSAYYSGDGNNADSESSELFQTINPPAFTWATTGSASGSVLAGQSATYNFVATPAGTSTFPLDVTFGCSVVATITCTFSPEQIPAGSGSTPVQVTVTTSGPNPPAGGKIKRKADSRSPQLPFALPLTAIATLGFARRKISRRSASVMFSCLMLIGVLVSCGGGGSAGGNGNLPASSQVVVTVSAGTPSSLFANNAADNWPLQTAQFTATVTNASNPAVIWAITPSNLGTIDANGLYTAPTVAAGLPGSVAVAATSVADPRKYAQVNETLSATTVPTPAGQPYTVSVYAFQGNGAKNVPVTLAVQ
ncbi:MAG: Ig-like domain repeat protein, partial [Acidobacteriales bacterium]|nr:Ig-like domain repeat protein [Terriglobales bacterium]